MENSAHLPLLFSSGIYAFEQDKPGTDANVPLAIVLLQEEPPTEQEMELAEKIAVATGFEDSNISHSDTQLSDSLEETLTSLGAENAIIFAESHYTPPEGTQTNIPATVNDGAVIHTLPIRDIANEVKHKKALWTALKTAFQP
ncbi:hypothetical protein FUAX_25160 [Fulvitalea axinellae]|uniref:Uncharacterized protein n=1 Tax=Fulvitalea axinellae TaxID=1182444 RepID=A0AAU9D6D7_9BACT|nr:hypothetical protein FUAX_25160 [Fulvitalea axinellae]